VARALLFNIPMAIFSFPRSSKRITDIAVPPIPAVPA